MTRKLIFAGSVVALILVVGSAVAGISFAQKGQLNHIYVEKDGDSTVVAVVEGKDITRGEVRIPAENHRAADPSLTEDESRKRGILVMVTDRVIEAEVERRDLVPTETETEDFRRITRDSCLGPEGQACREDFRRITRDSSMPSKKWDTRSTSIGRLLCLNIKRSWER